MVQHMPLRVGASRVHIQYVYLRILSFCYFNFLEEDRLVCRRKRYTRLTVYFTSTLFSLRRDGS